MPRRGVSLLTRVAGAKARAGLRAWLAVKRIKILESTFAEKNLPGKLTKYILDLPFC